MPKPIRKGRKGKPSFIPGHYIGIDPGKSGGLVTLDCDGLVLSMTKMLPTEQDLWNWFQEQSEWTNLHALIEFINPGFKGTNKSSMSKLYGNYMQLRGFLIASSIPFDHVMTAKWRKGLGIPPRTKTQTETQWKNQLKAKAQQLFPQEKVTLWSADALLIAEYNRRQSLGIRI